MEVRTTAIPGCRELQPVVRGDARGRFIKIFHRDDFIKHGMTADFAEAYYSVSERGVLRGLHFVLPPHDQDKLVYCTAGTVLDAVVDLRRGSPTYGKFETFELSAERANMVYIPTGCAHGFYVTSEQATMSYHVTTVYSAEHDAGILWNSAGVPWPTDSPLLSPRDREFPTLGAFDSPFVFEG